MSKIRIAVEVETPVELDGDEVLNRATPSIIRCVEQAAKSVYACDENLHPDVAEHFRLLELMHSDYVLARSLARDLVAVAPHAAKAMRPLYPEGLPEHPGYLRCAINAEQAGAFRSAIDYCEQALAEGWHGDWTRRIKRYKAMDAKSGKPDR